MVKKSLSFSLRTVRCFYISPPNYKLEFLLFVIGPKVVILGKFSQIMFDFLNDQGMGKNQSACAWRKGGDFA